MFMTVVIEVIHSMKATFGGTFVAGISFLVWISILFLVKRLVFSRIRSAAEKSPTRMDDIIVESTDFPLTVLIVLSGVALVRILLDLGARTDHLLLIALKGSVIACAVILSNNLVNSFLKYYGQQEKIRPLNRGIVRGIAKGVIAIVGLLIFLDIMGISITPLLASLGIGSLAIALALQDTLSNVFSGIYLMMDKPLREGDFIKLETGEQGYITEIGWRSTHIRMLPNNMVVLPNNKLTSTVLTNYYLPEKELAVLVDVGVHYDSDLKHVEKITCEVAKKILQSVPGGVAAFEPFIRYSEFADSCIKFTVILRAKEFTDQYLLKHEFIKALHERYAQEKITIPYPIRTLDIPPAIANRLQQL